MVDVVVSQVGVVEAGDILDVDDGVGKTLTGEGVANHSFDPRVCLKRGEGEILGWGW